MATPLLESNICRLCTAEFDHGFNIFESSNLSHQLDTIINRYLPLKVLDDGKLPRHICQSCNQTIIDISTFFDVLIAGQRRLRELWKEETERQRKEKKLSEKAVYYEDVNIDIPGGVSFFDCNHTISLAIEGREAPRRKPGRPRKPKPTEVELEFLITSDTQKTNEEQPAPEDIVDPEQALELMFKEAEEKRLTTGDVSGMRRRRRLPQRFPGEVQGKELEAILKDEGVIEPDEENEENLVEEEDEEVELQMNRETQNELEKGSDEENAMSMILEESEVEDSRSYIRNSAFKVKMKSKVGRPKKRRFVCEYCGKSFLHSGHFAHHIRTRHEQSQFICLTCKVSFVTKEELNNHQKEVQHTGEGISEVQIMEETDRELDESAEVELKCASCEKTFPLQSALTNHIVTQHITENSNVCDLCGKTFSHPSSVIYHKEVAHSKSAYVCTICKKGFKHKQLLQRHSLVHSDDRPFVCDVCGATFKTRANLYNHSNIHSEEKPYQCTFCDAKFSHKTSLILHTRWHTGEKPYTCKYCDKSFSQGGNLQEHMRIHTGEKPFSCEVCSKRFTTSSQHRLHMKRHTGERPWKCEYCGKDFLHKDSWKCHLRRHRGEKPFSCPVCPRTFTEQWALKKHVRLHTGEKPYACNICSKSFSDLSNLQKHKKIHKNLQPPMDDVAILGDTSASAPVSNDGDGAENAVSALTDGQHIFYVTADQTQLVIRTIGSEEAGLISDGNIEYSSMMDSDVAMVHLDEDESRQLNVELQSEQADDSESVLAIVGEDGADDVQQAIEITTEDGRRVTLLIPANGDPCEISPDY